MRTINDVKATNTNISSSKLGANDITLSSLMSNCYGFAFVNGTVIITDGVDDILNDEYNFIGKSIGDDINYDLEKSADIVIIYGSEFDGENFDEDFSYHVGNNDQNNSWSDKDGYTKVRSNLRSSKDVENSPSKISGEKERLFYRRKKGVNLDSNPVIKIVDPKEIEEILNQLKSTQ